MERNRDKKLRIAALQKRVKRAQRRAKRHLKPGISLVEEFLSERGESARKEFRELNYRLE